jgi:hypothetical protein
MAVGSLSACADADPVDGSAREAAVYEAVIGSIASAERGADDVPVVFVVRGDGGEISIDVQAAVAAAMVDEVDVRFADDRVETVDESADDVPVRDDGVLLAVGAVPDEGTTIDVPVERYLSESDRRLLVVTVRWVDPDWTVTSTAVVENPTD